MKSIHTYCYGNLHNGKESDVTIMLVATHWDKSVYKDKADFLDGLKSLLPRNSTLVQFIRKDRCFCTNLLKDKIKDIEKFIVQIVSEDKWSEKIPEKWMFSNTMNKIRHRRVISLDEIKKVLKDHGGEEQVQNLANDMLKYHHDAGKILHFNEVDLNEKVIIDVQWFVNAFKLIMTDRHHVKEFAEVVKHDWDKFYKTGWLPDSLLNYMWQSEDKKLLESYTTHGLSGNKKIDQNPRFIMYHKVEILLYMQRLGLMSSEGQSHYVPSMNKRDFGEAQKKIIMNSKSKSSILVFFFDFLPYFFFYRLVVGLIQVWKVLEDAGVSCLYKDAAVFSQEDHKIAVSVTPSSIQMQMFQSNSENMMLKNVTISVRKTVEETLQELTKTFHQHLTYKIGFMCDSEESQIVGKDVAVAKNFIEESNLRAGGKLPCPNHEMENCHEIDTDFLLAYWK